MYICALCFCQIWPTILCYRTGHSKFQTLAPIVSFPWVNSTYCSTRKLQQSPSNGPQSSHRPAPPRFCCPSKLCKWISREMRLAGVTIGDYSVCVCVALLRLPGGMVRTIHIREGFASGALEITAIEEHKQKRQLCPEEITIQFFNLWLLATDPIGF